MSVYAKCLPEANPHHHTFCCLSLAACLVTQLSDCTIVQKVSWRVCCQHIHLESPSLSLPFMLTQQSGSSPSHLFSRLSWSACNLAWPFNQCEIFECAHYKFTLSSWSKQTKTNKQKTNKQTKTSIYIYIYIHKHINSHTHTIVALQEEVDCGIAISAMQWHNYTSCYIEVHSKLWNSRHGQLINSVSLMYLHAKVFVYTNRESITDYSIQEFTHWVQTMEWKAKETLWRCRPES